MEQIKQQVFKVMDLNVINKLVCWTEQTKKNYPLLADTNRNFVITGIKPMKNNMFQIMLFTPSNKTSHKIKVSDLTIRSMFVNMIEDIIQDKPSVTIDGNKLN